MAGRVVSGGYHCSGLAETSLRKALPDLTLSPGRYQVRIGATDVATERTGVVHCDVEVPDYRALPLSMSGLLIASRLSGGQPVLAGAPLAALQSRLPSPPTASREFHASDELAVYAEVYDRQTPPHDLVIVTTVTGDDGHEVFREETRVTTKGRGDPNDVIPISIQVPVRQAGRYLLRVQAQSRIAQTRTVRRETTLSVVE